MAILALVFKIIGMILLCVIGLILLLLAVVLFLPLRYSVFVSCRDEIQLDAKVTWLLRLVGIYAKREQGAFQVKLRILWFQKSLFGDEKKAANKEKAVQKKENVPKKAEQKKESKNVLKKEESEQRNTKQYEAIRNGEQQKEIKPKTESEQKPNLEQKSKPQPKSESEPKSEPRQNTDDVKKRNVKKTSQHKPKGKAEKNWHTKRIHSFSDKTKRIGQRTQRIKQSVTDKKVMLTDKQNKAAVRLAWKEIQYLLRHYGPRCIKGEINFATGEPARTGMLTGMLSWIPWMYQKGFAAIPDFESEHAYIQGEVWSKGRIRGVHAAKMGIIMWRSKDVRYLLDQIKE